MSVTYINEDNWSRASAIVEVDKFFRAFKMNPKLNLNIMDFANYIGFKLNIYNSEDESVAKIKAEGTDKIISFNKLNFENIRTMIHNISYLLGYYHFMKKDEKKNGKKINDSIKSFVNFLENDKNINEKFLNNFKERVSDSIVNPINFPIYKDYKKEAKEGDPQLYYFANELASRDEYYRQGRIFE